MSMLAERRKKQKWSLNPRGNDWVQDSNKFGQKMLERMGWQHGKGLGAKENGITENIKVSYKNDSKGMGYKQSNDQWTEHETNFSALLESLSGEKPKEVKLNSLEKKSQNSRARVHYHKFTRGKDLSRYSEKDLANIFGKKSLKASSKIQVTEEKNENIAEKKESESKFLFNAGSMCDYFKKKLPSFGKSNGYVIGHNGVLKKQESNSESDVKPSFHRNDENEGVSFAGFGFKSETTTVTNDYSETKLTNGKVSFVSYVTGNSSEESNEKKQKKKRKTEDGDVGSVFSPKKKSRNNKEIKSVSESDGDKGVSNPAFNPLRMPVRIQKHVLDTIEESVSEGVSDSEGDSSNCVVVEAEVYDTPSKKKNRLSGNNCKVEMEERIEITSKTKNKTSKEIENYAFGKNESTLNDNEGKECEITCYEVKRKEDKNKKKQSNEMYENPNFEENVQAFFKSCPLEENPYEVKVKKNKKKKKESKMLENLNGDGKTEDSVASSITEETPTKKKTKKKKKDEAFALENPSFDGALEESIDLSQIEENPYEVKIKKKTKEIFENLKFNESTEDGTNSQNEENTFEVKIAQDRKKRKKGEDYTIENPNFNESTEDRANSSQNEENPFEVKIAQNKKKKKKGEDYAIENPNFNESTEDGTNSSQNEENPYEVKITQKKEKKKKGEDYTIENRNCNESTADGTNSSQNEENPYEVKITQKKEKKKKDEYAIENQNFSKSTEDGTNSQNEENPYEVKIPQKKEKKKKGEHDSIENPNFNKSTADGTNPSQNEENPYEVKITQKKQKKKKGEEYAIENPNFNETLEEPACDIVDNPYEIKPKRKKKKKKDDALAIDNPNFDPNNSDTGNKYEITPLPSEIKEDIFINIEETDLMLNIVTTPIIKKTRPVDNENIRSVTQINSVKRRKSVRFSDVTQERIIPSNEDLQNLNDLENKRELFEINTLVINNGLEDQSISFDMSELDKFNYNEDFSENRAKKQKSGLDNVVFDKHKTNLDENVDSISKTIERYQAEIENDINEKKLETLTTMEDIMVGEVGNPNGEHEKLSEGTKLKYKYASFESKTPFYHLDRTGARKSYKHLIKGDIVVGFKNTNLHEIQGYAIRKSSTVVR